MYCYPDKARKAVVDRYLNGKSISKTSQNMNVSGTNVYMWVNYTTAKKRISYKSVVK